MKNKYLKFLELHIMNLKIHYNAILKKRPQISQYPPNQIHEI